MSQPLSAANYRSVDVPLSTVHDRLMECPKCGGRNLTHDGEFRRRYLESFIDGQSVATDLKETVKQVQAIVCHTCQLLFRIVPDEDFNAKADLIRTKTKLAEKEGRLQEPVKPILQ